MTGIADELAARTRWIRGLCEERLGRTEGVGSHVAALSASAIELLEQVERVDVVSAIDRVVAAERYLRLVFELEGQYREGNAEVLGFACAAARDGYQTALLGAAALGVAGPDGGGPGRWPHPAVLLEPMRTPATYVRGTRVRALGLQTREQGDVLPFPVVMLPWYPKESLRALSIVQHEIGHDLDRDLGITGEMTAALVAALTDAGAKEDEWDDWDDWTSELVADALGTLLAGVAFPLELAAWAAVMSSATRTHPAPAVRVRVCDEILARSGVPADAMRARLAAVPVDGANQKYADRAGVIAEALLSTKLQGLEGGTIAQLVGEVANDHALLGEVAPRLVAAVREVDGDATRARAVGIDQGHVQKLAAVPLRLFPSLAALAITDGADPGTTADVLFSHAAARSREEATDAFRATLFAERTLSALRGPILDEGQDGLKRPPPDLFAKTRSIAFVGATQDSLPDLFRGFLDNELERYGRKDRLEIFFLTKAAVERLAHDKRDAAAQAALLATARAALTPALLSRVARSWAMYEHDEPYFFAAYWDATAEGGRIHVSNHGWGLDLKRAPGFDYVWQTRDPARSYRWYLDALAQLRLRATPLDSSDSHALVSGD